MSTHQQALLKFIGDGRFVRPRDLARAPGGPIPRMVLWRLHKEGILEYEPGHGYRLAGFAHEDPFEPDLQPFSALTVRHPDGVLCFRTALRLAQTLDASLDLTDHFTGLDFVACPHVPTLNRTAVGAKIVAWSNPALFQVGVEALEVNGVRIRYTNAERTAVDMLSPMRINGWMGAEEPFKVLKSLAKARGEKSLDLVDEYASELGWAKSVKPIVLAMKQALEEHMPSCAPQMR